MKIVQLRLFKVYEMVLSERQQKAQGLTRWLQSINAHVTNPMPLNPHEQLRFWVTNEDRAAVLAKVREQDWSPRHVSVDMRFDRDTLVPATTYEIDLPLDPPPVQDRRIYGEIAAPKKSDHEIEQVKRYLGLGPKK